MTILIVDDDPDEVDLARRAIAKVQVSVNLVATNSLEEAVAFLQDPTSREARVDLRAAFVDERLRGYRAADFIRAVRLMPLWRDLPIIVLAGSNDPSAIQAGMDAGANSYLVKPMDHREYADAILAATHYWGMLNATDT